MPEITKVFTIQVTPERFLESCSDNELKELDFLLSSERYHRRIREPKEKVTFSWLHDVAKSKRKHSIKQPTKQVQK